MSCRICSSRLLKPAVHSAASSVLAVPLSRALSASLDWNGNPVEFSGTGLPCRRWRASAWASTRSRRRTMIGSAPPTMDSMSTRTSAFSSGR